VLMYHRVAKLKYDPWELAVSPENFEKQLAILSGERTIVPLSWLASKLREGKLPPNVAAITFDDGYADVLLNAVPILEKLSVPAIVFITTGAIRDGGGFWWDVLSHAVLERKSLPERLALTVNKENYMWRIAESRPSTECVSRLELHRQLHRLIRPLKAPLQQSIVTGIAEWAGVANRVVNRDRSLTPAELFHLSQCTQVEIGAHTVSHPSLPAMTKEDVVREVQESRKICRELTGKPIAGFAYPFGDFDKVAVSAVRQAAFDYACSTEERALRRSDDPLVIPRLHIGDWEEEMFCRELRRYV
jgi:peptidoglycan/xylan/chitin deacetylase (PgdA/CDA1 family)